MTRYPEMNWKAIDLAEEFTLFKQRKELCLIDNEVTEAAKQAIKIKIALGNEGLRKINTSGLSGTDQEDPTKICEIFDNQLKVKVNFRIHRLELMRTLNGTGHHDNQNRIISENLLEKAKGHQIEQLLEDGRKYEAIAAGKECLQTLSSHTVNAISKPQNPRKTSCGNCGSTHPPRKCPAYYDTCKKCGTKGHWANVCRKSRFTRDLRNKHNHQPHIRNRTPSRHRGRSANRKQYHRKHSVKEMTNDTQYHHDDEAETSGDEIFHSIEGGEEATQQNNVIHSIGVTEAYTMIDIICRNKTGSHRLHLKIDTGSSRNTLPLRTLKQMYKDNWNAALKPTTARRTAYNGSDIQCIGTIQMLCRYKTSDWSKQTFMSMAQP
ncbi:uncharacterized protein LOC117107452 [Anneissia japonica]|uniref:uncharacterized protein LOC117107452 n=1 Tax=Anneissia japonica TaxID=1529436 RepID=UPI00142582E3|nr:uncharacterized protein LOC117107452 [Anneissia japonica]